MALEVEVDSGQYTPESLKLRRRLAEAMMKQGMDTSPIGSPWQGLARIAQAMMGGYQAHSLDEKEAAQQKAQNEAIMSLLGPMPGAAGMPASAPAQIAEQPITSTEFIGEVGPSSAAQTAAVVSEYAPAIAGIETPGEDDPYKAKGPVVKSGDRAYGKYQVMGANVGPWTKQILGREMTPDEFLNDPQAQEKVFATKFGEYVEKTGSPQDAASMWFTGKPAAEGADRRARDAEGKPLGITGAEYVEKFTQGLGGGQPAAQPAPQVAQMPPQVTPEVRQRIGMLLSNPATRPMGMAMIQKYITPPTPLTVTEQAELEKTRAQTDKLKSETQLEGFKQGKEISEAAIEDRYKLQDAISGIDDSWRATNDLINHPGLPEITGLPLGGEVNVMGYGVDIADLKPGTTQADAFNAHKSLVSQVALRTMDRLKQQSATGATGFGALSEKELKILENSIGNLRLSSSQPELVKNYKKFQDDLMEMRGRLVDRFERKYGKIETGVPSKTELFNSATESALELAERPYMRNQTAFNIPGTDYSVELPFSASPVMAQQPQQPPAALPPRRPLHEVMRAAKGDMLPFLGGSYGR